MDDDDEDEDDIDILTQDQTDNVCCYCERSFPSYNKLQQHEQQHLIGNQHVATP
jgi:hypothetical protein